MTLCHVDATHGAMKPRDYVHPYWRGLVRGMFCPTCGRAWLPPVRGTFPELNLHYWKELADVSM